MVVWTIIFVGEITLRAPLARVRGVNLLDNESFRLGLVREVLVQTVERPFVNRFRVR